MSAAEKGALRLEPHEVGYIKTIADAAAAGTVSREGMKVIGWLMCGWTLQAAKHQVYVIEPKLTSPWHEAMREVKHG